MAPGKANVEILADNRRVQFECKVNNGFNKGRLHERRLTLTVYVKRHNAPPTEAGGGPNGRSIVTINVR